MAEEKRYLTVTALTKYIRYKFDNDVHLTNVFLEGEISNFKHHSRGHFYFTLKDQGAQISATMFYSDARKVPFEPQDGMKVLVKGNVSVYEPQGSYNINVYEMEQSGIGSLYLAYEKLKKELQKEGLFEESHKKPLPMYPKAIGVLTSPTGAAVRDCINTITRRYPLATIYVYPTLVQGEDAKKSIVQNIKLANQQKLVDVLIVGRGGGSIEDLWAFNERIVAEAIYQSELPIISAVGHETDFTIADFVADKRAATPTAAAELATPNLDTLKETERAYQERIADQMGKYLKQIETNLVHLDERLEANNPSNKLSNMYQKKLDYDRLLLANFNQLLQAKKHSLDLLSKEVIANSPKMKLELLMQKTKEYDRLVALNMEQVLKSKYNQYEIEIAKLKALNPLDTMEKGFSIVRKENKIIRSKKDVRTGDVVSVQFVDGTRNAKIMEES